MKKFLLAISLSVICASVGYAQKSETRGRAGASNDTAAAKQGPQLNFQSGTRLAAQLENALDVRHAKTGDRVVLKTTQAVKQDGEVVVPKGARLIGRVTEVQQRTRNDNQSVIGIAFDRLQKGSLDIPITANIISITQAGARAGDDMSGSGTMARSSSSGGSNTSAGSGSGQRGGGGLLGGVGNTVGGVVNTTTSTVGNVAGSTTSAAGSTVGATTSATANTTASLRGLEITQSSTANAEGGSTLSLSGGNLRLESGTTFNLSISSVSSAKSP